MSVVVFVRRVLLLGLAAVFISLGAALNVRAELGQGPWQILHTGVSLQTGLTFGQAQLLVSVLFLGLGWLYGVRPGPGTLFFVAMLTVFVDLILPILPRASFLPVQVAFLVGGPFSVALGTSFAVLAQLGVGPRDAFMLALMRLTGQPARIVRTAIEVVVTLSGWALGGPLGAGTPAVALLIGPLIDLWFRLLRITPPRRAPRPEPAR